MTGAAAASPGGTMLKQAVGYALGTVSAVTPDLLGRPTPCSGWSLRMLLWHSCDSLAALSEGFGAGCVRLTAARESEAVTDPAELFMIRARGLLGLWSRAARPEIVVGGRRLSGGVATAAGALEIAIHGWDVAESCGARQPVPALLALALLRVVPLLVADAGREPLFGPPVPVDSAASVSDRLTAFLGRAA